MKNASYRRVSSADITHEKHIVMMTSFCRWQRVFRGVIFWVENCDVIFQQWQHINCVHIFKERWNIENDAVIFSEFSQTTTHFLSSLQTDKVAIYTDLFMSFLTSVQNKTVIFTTRSYKWTLWSVWKITTQKSQSSFRGHNIRYVMLSFQTGVCCGCVTPENFEHIEAKWCSLLHSRGKESTQSIMINHKFMWPKFEKKFLSIFHYNFWTVFVGKFLRFWTIFIAKW